MTKIDLLYSEGDTLTTSEMFLNLTYQSLLIFFGCLICGAVPIFVPISKKFMNYLSLFGAVVMSGVIMVIIIPEGFETLINAYQPEAEAAGDDDGGDDEGGLEWSAVGGMALIAGFVLILLVDLFLGLHGDEPEDQEQLQASQNRKVSQMLSVGFVFHSFCDGISLGASTYTGSSELILAIFVGIFFHKLVVSMTLSVNMLRVASKKTILIVIVLFSIAAPLGGYVVLGILVLSQAADQSVAPGVLILVSAGSLAYVGLAHALPEAIHVRKPAHVHRHHQNQASSNEEGAGSESDESQLLADDPVQKINWVDFVLVLVAVAIPIILTTCTED